MTNLMNTIKRRPVTFVRGEDSRLFDEAGKGYLDFFCDVGTSSLGYSSPQQKLAMEIAAKHPVHAPNLFGYKLRDSAAARLCKATEMDAVFFSNSGAESVEAAIKLARLYQHQRGNGRAVVYTQPGSFHGRTLATLAAGDGPAYHVDGFGPLPTHFWKFHSVEDINWGQAAAVLVSPVRGNNTVDPVPLADLQHLREMCSQHDVALIFDEVQSGSGRTSEFMTYHQKIRVKPDVVTLAKGLAMGAPVAATLARGAFAEVFTPGTHFSTFGGNPFSCAMLHGMLDWVEQSGGRSELIGMAAEQYLKQLPDVVGFRRAGALIAFDHPNPLALADLCLEYGLLIGAFRDGPGVVKITPPLNISARDMGDGLNIMSNALGALHAKGF